VFQSAQALLSLTKPRIAALVGVSAGVGAVLASPAPAVAMLWPVLGTWLLAMGSLALNQVQEREIDASMTRTSQRPLPSGRLGVPAALATVGLLLASGGALIAATGGMVALGLGVLTLVLYNGLYVMLKRVTHFAAVPGALIGAVPPAIGWVSAGGHLGDPRLAPVLFFLFMWQVPHFWLLLQAHPGDYEKAGLLSPAALFSSTQMRRLTFSWTAAAAVSATLFGLFGTLHQPLAGVALAVLAAAVMAFAGYNLADHGNNVGKSKATFGVLNGFATLTMMILVLDHGLSVWHPYL
jgi:heme o synthase